MLSGEKREDTIERREREIAAEKTEPRRQIGEDRAEKTEPRRQSREDQAEKTKDPRPKTRDPKLRPRPRQNPNSQAEDVECVAFPDKLT